MKLDRIKTIRLAIMGYVGFNCLIGLCMVFYAIYRMIFLSEKEDSDTDLIILLVGLILMLMTGMIHHQQRVLELESELRERVK